MSSIILTETDKKNWIEVLTEYFAEKGIDHSLIPDRIDSILKECEIGWKHCPRDIETRIKMKSGYQWGSHSNLRYAKPQEEVPEGDIENDKGEDTSLFGALTAEEKNWWKQRENEYQEDFEFNRSSDDPLLRQLLVEEILQRRLLDSSLRKKNQNYSRQISEGLKRIADIQTKLGITREQRAGILNKIDGNVAQLAVDLDEKLAKMPEEMKKLYEEELYYLSLRNQRPPVNILPPIEKIEAMLNVGGQIVANLESSQISAITEEVAKEIKEQREENKTGRKQLSEGMSV